MGWNPQRKKRRGQRTNRPFKGTRDDIHRNDGQPLQRRNDVRCSRITPAIQYNTIQYNTAQRSTLH